MATNQTNYDKYERLLQLYLEAHPLKKGVMVTLPHKIFGKMLEATKKSTIEKS